ncbi:hypothetical protein MPSEU_001077500 [Mayamaea pseudoterrestris]|nr:hypothetical protein MPSEU_001077500 [Mayamaea pseudoterrestris]
MRFCRNVQCLSALLFCTSAIVVVAQNYDQDYGSYEDYAQAPDDSLYADFAARQPDRQVAAAGGIGMGKLLFSSAASWFMGGYVHSRRASQKLKTKHQKEQKALYQQYYNDVYKLSEQNTELERLVEKLKDALRETEAKHELEALTRDYDEFKQPDIDGDDRISRAEFNMYVKNYLSNYPGLTESDYPRFEDFDHDGDGYVSFQEYAQQMALQAQKAEQAQLYGDKKSTQKNQALQDLYKDAAKGSSQYKNIYA